MSQDTELLEPIYPGEILWEEFMRPLDINIDDFSKELAIPKSTLVDIIQGQTAMTTEMALKFGDYFGVSPDLWLGLQMDYESRLAKYQALKHSESENELILTATY